MDLKCFYVFVMAVFVVPGRAFQGDISITENTEIGGNVTLTCSWTLAQNENFFSVSLRSLPVDPNNPSYYYYRFSTVAWVSPGNQNNSRMSYERFNESNNRAVVRITNVQCSDELTYSCYFTIRRPGLPDIYYEQTSYLEVKARPKTPAISLPPTTGDDILEFSNISAVCASNVGRPGRGSLQWKIYSSSGSQVILPTDPRLDALKNVTLPQGEDSCTQRVEQTFRMHVNRTDQNLTIACFVQNNDFQSQTPIMCMNSTTDLCGQTKSLRIVYPVNETDMTVKSDSPGAVYEDMTVTLTCQAAGLPIPTFTWAQVLDDNSTAAGNNTLSGELVTDKYQLILTDLAAYRGQELKYACTASNTVLNIPYSVTKEISIQVLMTTTTVRTTTTRTTPTTPTTTAAKDSNITKDAESQAENKDDDSKNTIIIVVVVVVGSILIIAIIIGIIFWRKRRSRKGVEEPSEKPSTNRTNLSYQSSQPDLVADKKFTSPSLDNSFSEKKEDGLMYADLTYDNRPRSRKPMAINDTSSEYSDIQMPQV